MLNRSKVPCNAQLAIKYQHHVAALWRSFGFEGNTVALRHSQCSTFAKHATVVAQNYML